MHARRQVHVVVRGLVHGVGFRYFAAREAERLALVGWVSNQMDGSVEALAQGPAADLETFLASLRRGPTGARVADLQVTWQQAGPGLTRFEVRHV